MKDLEKSLAELTRESCDELAAAKDEAKRLRQALTASKERVLSLRDALTAIAEDIDHSLELPAVARADHGENSDGTFSRAEDDDEVDHREIALERTAATSDEADISDDLAPSPAVTTSNTQEHLEIQDTVPDQDSSTLPPATEGQNAHATDAAIFRPITAHRDNSMPAQTEPVSALHPEQVEYRVYDHMHWQTSSGLNEGSRTFPTLLPADTPEEQLDILNCNLSFPPGVINFPSVFSAHLGVIEFFAKKNAAYTHRMQIGGAEA